ncbi:MAG: hypothetical protein ACRD2W_15060 [Acidimicrobiales bacterium]
MNALRRAILAGAAMSIVLVPGSAHAAETKEPDCTWTNDNIAVCKFKDGSSVCYDHYGKKIDCPAEKRALDLSLVGR